MSTASAEHSFYFQRFSTDVEGISLPEQFNYPFHYTPHPLALLAASELQHYLKTQTEGVHLSGLAQEDDTQLSGKMFGVLVVKNQQNRLGYICAISGKFDNQNLHQKFVPPVFDTFTAEGFYRKEEAVVSSINERIEELENIAEYRQLSQEYDQAQQQSQNELEALKTHNVMQREKRQLLRKAYAEQLTGDTLAQHVLQLNHTSSQEKKVLVHKQQHWRKQLNELETRLLDFEATINALKTERKTRSAALQDEIFRQFSFLNQRGEQRSLGDIFKTTTDGRPTAGAGECAAPKLLQYAFLNQLKPIAMAEFWWGESAKTVLREHGQFYPACRGKCEPILNYMLQGIDVEPNPMLKNPAEGKELEIVWEDEHIVVVNKPAEFLSVPGKNVEDSVYSRLRKRYPQATGPLVAHRLDMSTSGLLLAAKHEEAYKQLQQQFLERQVKKKYIAVLEGEVQGNEGRIELPLRVDLDDRPRQMVCLEHGKPAVTIWKVIERTDNRTIVHFFPITGRTHQLRVHAAHALGLHCPIVGDELYGTRADRLHLHAQWMQFKHPVTRKKMTFEAECGF